MKKLIIGIVIIGLLAVGYQSMNDSSSSTIPLPDSLADLSKSNFQNLVDHFEKLGVDKQQALVEALDYQLREVALLQKAKELGLEVSQDEVTAHIRKLRKSIETGISEDGLEVSNHQESLIQLESIINDLGITYEQYWNEYLPELTKYSLMTGKLHDVYIGSSPEVHAQGWQGWMDSIVSEFKENNQQKVQEFKQEIGMSN
ncbi:hypothetical protein [Desulfuribacillus alkaliarsenatis]|uniref:Uncharacterized protein n=1 Tax=Desulfuribacillus alkaliarsenatis TaxID=766136 RepID=A0A1E5FYP7_9FIRM|nr:hypothetical protein [Desulfuribacillus alkaliarsenatis]OEF95690.1 hypothetical protein BHF68_11325 [Desulfuribacillus alkaliarsenatis]